MTLNIKPPVGPKRPITTEERNTLVADLGLDDAHPRLTNLESRLNAGTLRLVNDTKMGLEAQPATGNVLSNDSSTAGAMQVSLFTIAGLAGTYYAGQTATIAGVGTLRINGSGAYTFTPIGAFNGAVPDVTYQVTNGTDIGSAKLYISVGAVDNAPVALDDVAPGGSINTPIFVSPVTNDSSPDGNPLVISHVNGAALNVGGPAVTTLNAQVALLTGNQLRITPNSGYTGTFNFSYTVTDTVNGLIDTATIVASFADPNASAVTYWVDASAPNDLGDGSAANPKKYIQSAGVLMSTFGGDTVKIKPGVYSDSRDRINNNIKYGKPGRWNTVMAETDGTVTITAGLSLDRLPNQDLSDFYLRIVGLDFDDNFSDGVAGRYVKVLRCFFRGGPLTDNTNNVGVGTNDRDPGSEYILFEDCLFYGVGGRYTLLNYDSDKVLFRRCVVRHQPGWGDQKGDPQGGISNYNSRYSWLQNCIVLDTPSMTNLEAAIYHPSNSRPANDCVVYGCIVINTATTAVAWDDGATTPNMRAEHCAFIDVGAAATSNGGAHGVTLKNLTVARTSYAGFRRYGGGTLLLQKSICFDMTEGAKTDGTTLDGSNNFTTPEVAGEGALNPALNGLLYPVRIESGSPFATAGQGATITKRMGLSETIYGETGWNTLTTQDLWPWPQEDRIKARLQADSAYGFCTVGRKAKDGVTDMKLSHYIWESLGNQIPSNIYAPTVPMNTTLPVITGEFVRGGTLTVSTGAWTPPPDSYSYQWRRNGSAISGATSPSYAVQVADVGTTVTCAVTGTNASGSSTPAVAVGAQVAEASAPGTVTPTITGDLFLGGTGVCSPGSISGGPAPTLSYQWKRGSTNVGTNSSTYVFEATGSHTCTVTATNLAGSSSGTSASVTVGGLTTYGDTFSESSLPVTLAAHTASGPNGGFAYSAPAGFSGVVHTIVVSGAVRTSSIGAFQPTLLSLLPTSADQDISATLSFSGIGRSSWMIGGRISADGTTGYWIQQGAGTWSILKRTGGTFVTLATASESSGGTYGVRLRLRNGLQQLFKGGVLLCSSNDADFTAPGRVGVGSYYTETTADNQLSNLAVSWPA